MLMQYTHSEVAAGQVTEPDENLCNPNCSCPGQFI